MDASGTSSSSRISNSAQGKHISLPYYAYTHTCTGREREKYISKKFPSPLFIAQDFLTETTPPLPQLNTAQYRAGERRKSPAEAPFFFCPFLFFFLSRHTGKAEHV